MVDGDVFVFGVAGLPDVAFREVCGVYRHGRIPVRGKRKKGGEGGSLIYWAALVSALYVMVAAFLSNYLSCYYREWGKFWILLPEDGEVIGEDEIGGAFLAAVWPLSLVWIFLMWVFGCGRSR